MNLTLALGMLLLVALTPALLVSTDAHPHDAGTADNHPDDPPPKITPMDGLIGLEQATIHLHVPEDNTLPWGYVDGRIVNHVDGYPVIIQIFRDGDVVHFAQTDVAPDGTYEYRFRVLNSDDGVTTKIFDGFYTVKIFKVVYLSHPNMV